MEEGQVECPYGYICGRDYFTERQVAIICGACKKKGECCEDEINKRCNCKGK